MAITLKFNTWEDLIKECSECKKCELSNNRTNVVFGRGNEESQLLIVGEGPGEQEDLKGSPFVGAAGQLLDLALNSCCIVPEDYYITNVVKCRPPANRNPNDIEVNTCLPYLRAQFAFIRPKIILCLGKIASTSLISPNIHITRDRGNWINKKGFYFMPTFHPAALLRDQSKKIEFMSDIMKVQKKLAELKA